MSVTRTWRPPRVRQGEATQIVEVLEIRHCTKITVINIISDEQPYRLESFPALKLRIYLLIVYQIYGSIE